MPIRPHSDLMRIVKNFIDSPGFKNYQPFTDEEMARMDRAMELSRWRKLKDMEEEIWVSQSQ